MAVFRFKLKPLHRLKIQLEDQAKNRFGLAVAALNAEIAKLNAIYAAIQMTYGEFRRLSGGRFTAGKIKDYNNFIAAMKEKAAAQEAVVEEAKRRVELARGELIAAMREREMYDKLREKAYAKYIEDERRAEYSAIDELVSYRVSAPQIGEMNG